MKHIIKFFKSLIKYIIYGNRVDFHIYTYRLLQCSRCKYIISDMYTCDICKCKLNKKCMMSTESCPKNIW